MLYSLGEDSADAAKLVDLPESELVAQVRAGVSSPLKEVLSERRGLDKTVPDLRELAFAFPQDARRVREFMLEKRVGRDWVGCVVAGGPNSSKTDPIYDYCCVILCDGTSFEGWTPREECDCTYICRNAVPLGKCHSRWDYSKLKLLGGCRVAWKLAMGDSLFGNVHRGGHLLLGRFFYSKNLVTWDSLRIEREGEPSLPIHLDRNGNLFESLKTALNVFFRVVTLAPLWAPPRWLVNNDLVIPAGAPALEDDDATAFYFMINVVFRAVFFDFAFHTGGGD